MTTTSAPFGVRPAYHQSGMLRPVRRTIAAAYTTPIYKGDPVIFAATGMNIAVSNSGQVDGIFAGCEYIGPTGRPEVSPYWPGTASCTNIVAYVWEDVDAVYEAQCTGAVALTDIGSHIGIDTAVGTGSTATGLSLAGLLFSSISASTEGQFQIVDLAPIEGNAWGDTYTIVRVKLAKQGFNFPPDAF